jgi:DNA replication protein DnaC
MNDMIKVVDNILRENTEKPNIRERDVERTRQDDEEHDEQHRERRREQHMEKPMKQQKEEFKTVSNKNIDSKKVRSRIKPKLEKDDLSDTESILDRFLEKEIKELEEENKENSINNLD